MQQNKYYVYIFVCVCIYIYAYTKKIIMGQKWTFSLSKKLFLVSFL